jgi:iturin family lipopeptide synthetase C
MCIAGKGVTRGYMNVPGLTAERYPDNPYEPGQRLLKTGDIARWQPDGNIEFSARSDFQVKIRGFRIEMGEIEQYLLGHEEIKECVVTANDSTSGDKYLCAYIATRREPGVTELREYLSTALPEYMIPAYFVHLDRLPLSPNGKINRKALPTPEVSTAAQEYIPPAVKSKENWWKFGLKP